MAESVRRLADSGAFSLLQEKLKKWNDDYLVNTTDQNVTRCVEMIELSSRVQAQLFSLLNLCAAQGSTFAGTEALKHRLLPWLASGFAISAGRLTADTSLKIIAESTKKERELELISDDYEQKLDELEHDLNTSRGLANDLKAELDETKALLEKERNVSMDEAIITEDQVGKLTARIKALEGDVSFYKGRAGVLQDYELEANKLRNEVSLLREEKAILTGRNDILISPNPAGVSSLPKDSFQRIRQATLISRFSDMFARERMDAMDILRNHCDDHELNQKIVFTCVQEAFHAAKLAFNRYRSKVYAALQTTHSGPETLSEAVQLYINKNGQLLDVHSIVEDVLLAMNRHPIISFPAEVNFRILTLFIRELVKLAWSMVALPSPLDIAPTRDGELFDEAKYRRTYDSEYTAALVAFYIWPALVDATGRVLLKGEAVTRRGGSLASPRRSRSPSRALSPRSRSPSPRRLNGTMSPAGSRAASSLSNRPSSAASSVSLY